MIDPSVRFQSPDLGDHVPHRAPQLDHVAATAVDGVTAPERVTVQLGRGAVRVLGLGDVAVEGPPPDTVIGDVLVQQSVSAVTRLADTDKLSHHLTGV